MRSTRFFSIVPTVLEGGASAEDLKNTVRFAIQPVVKAPAAGNQPVLPAGEREGVSNI